MTVRRLKTYAGSQGYVYQYYFVGQRPAGTEATEYVFDVTSDRKTAYPVRIILLKSAVAAWNRAHGRALSDSERYAAVKLRLFRAFDEFANLENHARALEVESGFLEESLASLGVD